MRIVFMGTPEFAAVCLNALLKDNQNIIAVFTNPDKPKGRGQQLAMSPVKELAVANEIEVYQPKGLKNEETASLIKSLSPDMIIVVAYGKIIPKNILEIPPHGCINVHGSILPKYRGAAPIQWSVLNGDAQTGITTMLMNEGIDTGDILLIDKTPIGENETASELFVRLSSIGAQALIKTLKSLNNGEITPKKQDESEATYAPMLSKDMSNIDFSNEAVVVHHTICGLSEWPCAVVSLDGKRLKIYKSEVCNHLDVSKGLECGTICEDKNSFIVACGKNTAIKLVSVQYEGSKRMEGGAFLRGRHLLKGTILKRYTEA